MFISHYVLVTLNETMRIHSRHTNLGGMREIYSFGEGWVHNRRNWRYSALAALGQMANGTAAPSPLVETEDL